MRVRWMPAAFLLSVLLMGCVLRRADAVISFSGSTSMEEAMKALGEAFTENHPEVTVEAQFCGSGQGIRDVTEGRAGIGGSSRALHAQEKGLRETLIALDGIAVVVHPDNPVERITAQELRDIYIGEIRNWNDIGGGDHPIVVVGREAGSGTRTAVEMYLGAQDQCICDQEKDSAGGVKLTLSTTSEAIGYLSLDAVDECVKPLLLDDTAPTAENIRTGKYTLTRPFLLLTNPDTETRQVMEFIAYARSEEGQHLLESLKLIPAGEAGK